MKSFHPVAFVAVRFWRSAVVMLWGVSAVAGSVGPKLINAALVSKGDFSEVVLLKDNGSAACTGTIVGPRTIITAAHCIPDKTDEMTFEYDGTTYTAQLTPSPKYAPKNKKYYDVALGLVTKEIKGAKPFTIGGTAVVGESIQMVGYGCHSGPPTRTWDGKKREVSVEISSFDNPLMVSISEDGKVPCDGDSGGPAFTKVKAKNQLLGIVVATDYEEISVTCRLDLQENTDFLADWAKTNKAEVCGVNLACK